MNVLLLVPVAPPLAVVGPAAPAVAEASLVSTGNAWVLLRCSCMAFSALAAEALSGGLDRGSSELSLMRLVSECAGGGRVDVID